MIDCRLGASRSCSLPKKMTETIPFVNGIRLVPVTHVSIVLREMYGVSLSQSVSAWDITEFLRGAFSDSVFDVLIQAESV